MLLLSLVLFVTLFQVHAAVYADGQLQPGVYPAPALPSNFTKSSDFWRFPAAAPKVDPRQKGGLSSRKTGKELTSHIGRRAFGRVWSGWQDIHYLFALYVICETTGAKDGSANSWTAVIPTRPLASIQRGSSRIQTTRSETHHTLDQRRRMVQTTWTFWPRRTTEAIFKHTTSDTGVPRSTQPWWHRILA